LAQKLGEAEGVHSEAPRPVSVVWLFMIAPTPWADHEGKATHSTSHIKTATGYHQLSLPSVTALHTLTGCQRLHTCYMHPACRFAAACLRTAPS
jgi:hypothetical protein